MSDKGSVRGIRVKLDRGGSVFGAAGDDDDFLWLFINPEGEKTSIRISNEAMRAVVSIYGRAEIQNTWVVVKNESPTESRDVMP